MLWVSCSDAIRLLREGDAFQASLQHAHGPGHRFRLRGVRSQAWVLVSRFSALSSLVRAVATISSRMAAPTPRQRACREDAPPGARFAEARNRATSVSKDDKPLCRDCVIRACCWVCPGVGVEECGRIGVARSDVCEFMIGLLEGLLLELSEGVDRRDEEIS